MHCIYQLIKGQYLKLRVLIVKMSAEIPVNVNIEYCVVCDLKQKCEDLKSFIKLAAPNATINCVKGSAQGAFEVTINDKLIYSKIQKKTYPEFEDIRDNVVNSAQKKPMTPVRPTKDECVIM